MKHLICLFFVHYFTLTSYAQKAITLEDIWTKGTFSAKSVPGFTFQKDGKHYTTLEKNVLKQYDLTTGLATKDLFDAANVKDNTDFKGTFDGYTFSNDESKILLTTETEAIYRYSAYNKCYVWDGKKLNSLYPNGKQRYATFSPQADKVAFVCDNNLFIKDLNTNRVTPITSDGKQNSIINGATDWVYEEEFALVRAFEWSPDGKKIAFLRSDETKVPEFSMDIYKDGVYPEKETFKYPKVGENNSVVTVFIYDVAEQKLTKVKTGDAPDVYFPRIRWTQNAEQLCVFKMNRHQNELELLLADTKSGETKLLLKETNKYYIEIERVGDNVTFLQNNKNFIYTSDKDGFNHIYLCDMAGKEVAQLTKGSYDVTDFYGIDEARNLVYFQAAEASPMDKQVFSVNYLTKKKTQLTSAKGTHTPQFSSNFDYFVDKFSTINSAQTFSVFDHNSKLVRTIEDNKKVADLQREFAAAPVEFFKFQTTEKVELNGWMMKPKDFDASKKYPVFMYLYGGPGSQQVNDEWKGANYWWFQMLTQKGYIVTCVDNRGTGARGAEFQKMTYQQLGKYETVDQLEAAKYYQSLPFVDAKRIGIFGWSYGGYMSSLCILKGCDILKAAIAVAPVTNWKWYDSIYTERYMRTEKENPTGYHDNSPVYFADKLKGNYLLIHGTADDNVHFQNSVEMSNALIKANKQYDTYYYPNRNHGIYGDNARIHLYTKMTNFLLEKL